MKGRKPVPTQLKVLRGTNRLDRQNKGEMQPPIPESVPYAPRFMNARAKTEWRRLIGVLLDLGLYTDCDRSAFAMYCQACGRWVIAEEHCAKEGEILTSEGGGLYQNPWRYEANKAQEQIRRMLPEFGLTPSSRARLSTPELKEQDPFAEFLNKSKSNG